MKVVILCGGLGTRLREETEFKPKPMVDIGGVPMLLHLMKFFAFYGFKEFILCLGYKGEAIKDYFLHYEEHCSDFTIMLGTSRKPIAFHGAHEEQGYKITMADTGSETNTGGRIKRVQKYVKSEPFIVTYGDGISNVNIKSLVAAHKKHGKIATVTTVRPISRFGMIELSEKDKVLSFAEKPLEEGWMNAGFFVFNSDIFEYISGDEIILEREPLENLTRDGQLMAYRHKGFFFAMDTYREYKMLNDLWASGKAPWKVWK